MGHDGIRGVVDGIDARLRPLLKREAMLDCRPVTVLLHGTRVPVFTPGGDDRRAAFFHTSTVLLKPVSESTHLFGWQRVEAVRCVFDSIFPRMFSKHAVQLVHDRPFTLTSLLRKLSRLADRFRDF